MHQVRPPLAVDINRESLKWMLGYPRFLLRGLVSATAELALGILCYNLKRTLSIFGVPDILIQLRTQAT
ncbi:MAG: hypothetical protein ACREVG_00080 [Burkholderiales bacterium]